MIDLSHIEADLQKISVDYHSRLHVLLLHLTQDVHGLIESFRLSQQLIYKKIK